MTSISAASSAIAPHVAAAQTRTKSGKPDGDGDHGVEPAAAPAQAASSGKAGGVNLTA